MATFLLCLFGGLSAYSFFDFYEIRREIEETAYSDIPLFRTVIAIKQQNQELGDMIEGLETHRGIDNGEHFIELGRALYKVYNMCSEISDLTEEGYEQSQTAVEEEYLKEGSIRLNQNNENYQEISNLLRQFSASHHVVSASLNHLKDHAYNSHLNDNNDLERLLQDISNELDKSDVTIQEIVDRLDLQMQSSLTAAMHEQRQLQLFSLGLAITAIASGILFTVSLIYQLQNSLMPVTQKARKIAQALSEENYEESDSALNDAEIARTVTAGKEIAELGLAFNQMVENFTRTRQAQLQTEQVLAKEKSFMSFTLGSISDGVITLDPTGRVITANPAAGQLLTCEIAEIANQDFIALFQQKTSAIWPTFEGSRAGESQKVTIKNPDGQLKILDISYAPIRSSTAEILGCVIVLRDITQTIKIHDQLAWQASHDSLTGLANRRNFLACLEGLSHDKYDGSTVHSLLYLDLDRFKIVNDTCGHAAGDELLIQLARHINNEIRQTDLLARLGGDEFGIILKHCSLEKAIVIGKKILAAVNQFRFFWVDQHFSVGVSIGAVPYYPGSDNPALILKAADQACYNAKHHGRNQVFSVSDTNRHLANQSAEMNWLTAINQALEHDDFQLCQQKIIEVNVPNSIHEHYEILLRLKAADGEILPPGAFLPIAERYGLMGKIDRWVISHFFRSQSSHLYSLAHHPELGGTKQSFYSLNLSSDSLNDPYLIDFLQEQFECYKIPPALICFEVTETTAIANLSRASKIIQDIKNLGCQFALDDFGSGMSSFGYLQKLPVDFLKIDGQFIQKLCHDSMNEIIVTALHDVAQALDIKTIAEFVEDQATLEKLRDIGIDYAQGYYIDKPKPTPQLSSLKQSQYPIVNIA